MFRMIPSLFVLACTAQASKLDEKPSPPAPRNLVCERVALLHPKTTCVPELSDVGDGHVSTARVGDGPDTQACGIGANQASVLCGPLFYDPARAQAQEQAAKAQQAAQEADQPKPPAKRASLAVPGAKK